MGSTTATSSFDDRSCGTRLIVAAGAAVAIENVGGRSRVTATTRLFDCQPRGNDADRRYVAEVNQLLAFAPLTL